MSCQDKTKNANDIAQRCGSSPIVITDDKYEIPRSIFSKSVRKLMRLQTRERYVTNELYPGCYEVFTRDMKLKAIVDDSGIIIQSDGEPYDKVSVYKLHNCCKLMQKVHWGIEDIPKKKLQFI